MKWKDAAHKRTSYGHEYLKDKDLALIPFLIAHEAQKLGFWVRSIIVWEKENLLPESTLDRPILSHEYVLLLAKSKTYKWNRKLSHEPSSNGKTRQLRSVWAMQTSQGTNGHPASYPESLVERCIITSTSKGDIVLDPFLGGGTTALVANRLARRFIGVDVVKGYLDIAAQSLLKQTPDIAISWEKK